MWKLKILIESSHTLKKLKEDVPSWWRQFENGTDDTKNRIKDHIFLYLKMWDPTSGYSIRVNPKNLGSTILNDPTEGGVNIHDYSGMYKIFKRWSRWQRWNSFCYSTIVSSTWQKWSKITWLKSICLFFPIANEVIEFLNWKAALVKWVISNREKFWSKERMIIRYNTQLQSENIIFG